ncbi:hypothetical protein CCYA_CCYA17G4357 [Cyanidiococcus yangmingshanensis]|nr:hypothetical protein CCYA_CCYA17G4357 [Cyanidiococcus yangmingshanensis]
MSHCFRAQLAEDSFRHAAQRRASWLSSCSASSWLDELIPACRASGQASTRGLSSRALTQARLVAVEGSPAAEEASPVWVLVGDLGGRVWLGCWQAQSVDAESTSLGERTDAPAISHSLLAAGDGGRVSALVAAPPGLLKPAGSVSQSQWNDGFGAAFSLAGFGNGRIVLIETARICTEAIRMDPTPDPDGERSSVSLPPGLQAKVLQPAPVLAEGSISTNTTAAAITGIACSPTHVRAPFFVWCNATGSWGMDVIDGSGSGGFRALERVHLRNEADSRSSSTQPLVSGVDIHPDGALVALAVPTPHPLFWDIRTAACYGYRQYGNTSSNQTSMSAGRTTSVRWHPNGWHLACATTGGVILVWDIRQCNFDGSGNVADSAESSRLSPLYRIPAHSGAVNGLAFGTFAPRDQMGRSALASAFLASTGFDGTIRVWDANTYALCADWPVATDHQRLSLDVIASPFDSDGRASYALVLAAQSDRLLHLFRYERAASA